MTPEEELKELIAKRGRGEDVDGDRMNDLMGHIERKPTEGQPAMLSEPPVGGGVRTWQLARRLGAAAGGVKKRSNLRTGGAPGLGSSGDAPFYGLVLIVVQLLNCSDLVQMAIPLSSAYWQCDKRLSSLFCEGVQQYMAVTSGTVQGWI